MAISKWQNDDLEINIPLGEWNIQAFETVHLGSVMKEGKVEVVSDETLSRAYVMSYKDSKIGISGDSGNAPVLKEIAPDLDVFVLEATFKKDDIDSEVLEKFHLNYKTAKEIGSLSKDYILYYMI